MDGKGSGDVSGGDKYILSDVIDSIVDVKKQIHRENGELRVLIE